MKIYLASSWRNGAQPEVLAALRAAGHVVYDFRNPGPGKKGFAWSDIEPDWLNWADAAFRECLGHPIAQDGFENDWSAMLEAEGCVLLLPCGRSAHIEAGYFVGARKRLLILMLGKNEPELMYKMANWLALSIEEAVAEVNRWESCRRPDGKIPSPILLR